MRTRLIPLLLWASFPCGGFAAELRVPEGASEAVITLPDGFKVKAELALTRENQTKGLMFRAELKEDRGMLFVFKDDGPKSFWMKNTYIELDMVFADDGMKVRKIFHRVPPSRPGQSELELARAAAPARCVLELAGGTARRHGLRTGSSLRAVFSSPSKNVKSKDGDRSKPLQGRTAAE